ncbi:MAG: universal stress protein [Desulfuromonadales bacterium]|nr:universal stress protein [Desulfuromonadales bacterium]
MLPEIKTILYATDLGPGSPHVFRYALSLAQRHQGRITILKAMEPLTTFGQSLVELHISHNSSEQLHAEARAQVKQQLEERLHEFCAKEACVCDEQLVTGIRVVEGQPAEVILAEARTLSADLIVMGTHRHSAIGEALLGSTAHKVLHRSEIPVLLVRVPESQDESVL